MPSELYIFFVYILSHSHSFLFFRFWSLASQCLVKVVQEQSIEYCQDQKVWEENKNLKTTLVQQQLSLHYFYSFQGVNKIDIDMEGQKVYVTTALLSDEVLAVIKKTGRDTQYIGTKPVTE